MDQKNIRNFCIIAHVDHGKSTLADRLLELTSTVSKEKMQEQFLDQNPISRERGITIKLAPVRMNYTLDAINYTLNLIDTPGHVDFSYEVSRTLAACEGAILLVDATQGIQAQTVAHYLASKKENLKIIPVINKIDLQNANVEMTIKELIDNFGFIKEEILLISAKTGKNVDLLLERIVEKFPPPQGLKESFLRALIFDAAYDEYRGVVGYVRVVDGEIRTGDKVTLYQGQIETEIKELGYFSPSLIPSSSLLTGEIGYIVTGIKDIRKVRIGETIANSELKTKNLKFVPLTGYKVPKPMVFFGVYPKSTDNFVHLKESLEKLKLNDAALSYKEEHSSYLGSGFRVGFLGLLHAEIVKERLKQEFTLDLLFAMPQVLYEKDENGNFLEPYMLLTIFTPHEYVGAVMLTCQQKKGTLLDMSYHDAYVTLSYEMPYSMFIRGLSSDLKAVSKGFVSVDYEITDYKIADLVNLEVLINSNPIDILSELVYRDESIQKATEKAKKLKETLTRMQFRQIIQSVVEGKILAREEIPPFRKDVLAKMSGGDRTRKDKLLDKQKKGKSRLKNFSKVDIPQEALYELIQK